MSGKIIKSVRDFCKRWTVQNDENVPTKFTDLNEYCLIAILENLTIQEQIRLSQCYHKLQNIRMKTMARHLKTHHFVELSKCSNDEVKLYFRWVGVFVESIEIFTSVDCVVPYFSTAMYHSISQYCTNLQRLELSVNRWAGGPMELTKFLNHNSLDTITEVDVRRCNIKDDDMEHFLTMPNLIALGLAYNEAISGKHIDSMNQLKRLSLAHCGRVTLEALVVICQVLDLNYLDICYNIYPKLNAIVEHCAELQELRFSIDRKVEWQKRIAKLPRLKSLTIYMGDYSKSDRMIPRYADFFRLLADYHSEDLEELKIYRITDRPRPTFQLCECIKHGIKHFRNLRTLWLCNLDVDVILFEPSLNQFNFTKVVEINLSHSDLVQHWQILSLIKQCSQLKRMCAFGSWTLTDCLVAEIISTLESRPEVPSHRKKTPLLLTVKYSNNSQELILKNSIYLNAKHLLRISFKRQYYPYTTCSISDKSFFDSTEPDWLAAPKLCIPKFIASGKASFLIEV